MGNWANPGRMGDDAASTGLEEVGSVLNRSFATSPAAVIGGVRWADDQPLEEVVFQALGEASACWEDLSGAGMFDSDHAKGIGDELVEWLRRRDTRIGAIYDTT
jgi:hypothetical protein